MYFQVKCRCHANLIFWWRQLSFVGSISFIPLLHNNSDWCSVRLGHCLCCWVTYCTYGVLNRQQLTVCLFANKPRNWSGIIGHLPNACGPEGGPLSPTGTETDGKHFVISVIRGINCFFIVRSVEHVCTANTHTYIHFSTNTLCVSMFFIVYFCFLWMLIVWKPNIVFSRCFLSCINSEWSCGETPSTCDVWTHRPDSSF